MKVYVHYLREAMRIPLRVFNVDAVEKAGVSKVKLRMTFGEPIIHEQVARVVIDELDGE